MNIIFDLNQIKYIKKNAQIRSIIINTLLTIQNIGNKLE